MTATLNHEHDKIRPVETGLPPDAVDPDGGHLTGASLCQVVVFIGCRGGLLDLGTELSEQGGCGLQLAARDDAAGLVARLGRVA
jgi:hypothetical protein